FLVPGAFRQRLIEQVKILVDLFGDRLQAARAYHLDLRLQLPDNPDLPFQQLRGRRDLQRLHLLYFADPVFDTSRTVTLPDAQFADGKILDVEEHVFSASGSYAHAFPLFRHLVRKSRKLTPHPLIWKPISQPYLLVPLWRLKRFSQVTA